MKTLFVLFFILFSNSLSLRSQTVSTSKLFDIKRQLIADSNVRLTKKQFNKWLLIEDTLTKLILDKLYYPQVEEESGESGKIIISFSLDENGGFSNFKLMNYSFISNDSTYYSVTSFKKSAIFATKTYSAIFSQKGFKTEKKKVETYYLPIRFYLGTKVEKSIKDGWLTFEKDPRVIKITH